LEDKGMVDGSIKEYLDNLSWRNKENANTNESFSNMTNYVVGKILALDFLDSIPEELRKAHLNAIIHIHNLETGGYVPYSYNPKTPLIIKRDNCKMIVAMEDVSIGDYVIDKAGVAWTKITDKIEHNSHCNLLRIKFSNGSIIEVTEDHPIIMWHHNRTKLARDIIVGDLVQGCNISSRDFSFSSYELNRKLSWIIGMYIAEGNRSSSSYEISQNNVDIETKLMKYLEDMSIHYWKHHSEHKTSYFLYNKQLELDCLSTIKDYSENKNIPYLPLSLQTFFDIISGIFDGDGCRTNSKFATQFKISSKSFELVQQIKLVFDVARIVSSIRFNSDNIYEINFYLLPHQVPLFRESMKINMEPIKFFKGSKNLGYFRKKVRVIKISTVPYVNNKVMDITTETSTFCSMGLKLHNCAGHNLKMLLTEGMKTPSINSRPAKHFNSIVDQVMNWLYCAQMEFAGAQSFSDFDSLLAPFIRKDKLKYCDVKQQIQKLVYNLNFCYDEQTEVLTSNGFKLIRDVNAKDMVLTLNMDTDELQWQFTDGNVYKFNYNGYMYNFTHKNMDLMVTPNHRIVILHKDKWIFKEARHLENKQYTLPITGKWYAKDKDYFYLPMIEKAKHDTQSRHVERIQMDDFLRLLGIFLSEGCTVWREKKGHYYLDIAQQKCKIRDEIKDLLDRLPFNYVEHYRGFHVYSKQLANYFRQFGHAYDKFIPSEFKNLSIRQLNILLEWLFKGDGYVGECGEAYYTVSKKLRDDVQECLIKVGNGTNWSYMNNNKIFRIAKKKRNVVTLYRKNNLDIVPYNGKVYCLKVPNGNFVVRRNGKIIICGNTMRASSQCYVEGTEVLTKRGWVDFRELKMSDIAMTINTNTRKLEWKIPNRIVAYDYNDEIITLENHRTEQSVTHKHKILRYIPNTNTMVLQDIDETLNYKTPLQLPICFDSNFEEIDVIDDEIKLWAWILSEGSNRYTITQSIVNEENATRIKSILCNLGIKYNDKIRQHGGFEGSQPSHLISFSLPLKGMPFNPMDLSKRQAKLFLDEFRKGDGDKSRFRLYNKNTEIVDILTALAIIAGYSFHMLAKRSNGVQPISIITDLKDRVYNLKKKFTRYNGKVYCITTDNNTVVTRINGKPAFSGNTPFTNLTLNYCIPKFLGDEEAIIGGVPTGIKYSDCTNEVLMIDRAINEVMSERDPQGLPFSVIGDTIIPVINGNNEIKFVKIKELFNKTDIKYGESEICKLNYLRTWSLDSNNKMVIFPLKEVSRHKFKGKLMKIRIEGGAEAIVTPNHSLFTQDEEFKIKEIKSVDIKKNDVIIIANKLRFDEFKSSFKIKNIDKAFLMGYIFGDGYTKFHHVQLCASSREEADIIQEKFRRIYGFSLIEKEHENYIELSKHVRWVAKDIQKYIGSSPNKIIKNWVFESNEVSKAFFDGLNLADGHRSMDCKVYKNIGCHNETNKFKLILLSLRLGFSISYGNDYILTEKKNFIYKKDQLFRKNSRRGYKLIEKYPELNSLYEDDITPVRVELVEEIEYDDYVYDISANGTFIDIQSILYKNTFPILTVNLNRKFPWNDPAIDFLWDNCSDIGSYYFMNYIGSGISEDIVRSMCCRLNLSLEEFDGPKGMWNCYSNDTEILTINGWKLFKNLLKTDKVATLENDELKFVLPSEYITTDYKGKMLHQKTKFINLLVTPNHRLWVKKRKSKNFEFIPAEEAPRHISYSRTAKWNSNEERYFVLPPIKINRKNQIIYNKILMDNWLAFFGIWTAEGCTIRDHYKVVISQHKKENLDTIANVIRKCGFHYNYSVKNGDFVIRSKRLFEYLKQFGHSENRFIPMEIKCLSSRQLNILYNYLMLGNGSIGKDGKCYYTKSKSLADDFQEILLKIGLSGQIKYSEQKFTGRNRLSTTKIYRVCISNKKSIRVNSVKDNREWIDYDGKIYCVTVPSHLLYVRREGKPVWCGNTGQGTGSLGVVTINLPRLAYDCRGKDLSFLFEELDNRLQMALDILRIRKSRILKYQNRMMPFNIMNGWSMKNYFMTIGVIGLNEMCLNYSGRSLVEDTSFVTEVLTHIRNWISSTKKETKELINLEMVPGEGCSYRLAKIDRSNNSNIHSLGGDVPYYSTLLIPGVYDIDIISKVEIEENILPLFTGGTIFRAFIGDKRPSIGSTRSFINMLAKSKIPYFDMTSTYSICTKDGSTERGVHTNCSKCGSNMEVYSRVVGYYRPVSKWNLGKVAEFHDRKYINI